MIYKKREIDIYKHLLIKDTKFTDNTSIRYYYITQGIITSTINGFTSSSLSVIKSNDARVRAYCMKEKIIRCIRKYKIRIIL